LKQIAVKNKAITENGLFTLNIRNTYIKFQDVIAITFRLLRRSYNFSAFGKSTISKEL
jgi:hypothetical protein